MSDFTQLLSPGLTFIAAALAAGITWLVAQNRVRVDIITAGRQRWIDALREDLSELLQQRLELRDVAIGTALLGLDDKEKRTRELIQRVRFLEARILLRMDETQKEGRENSHISLARTVRSLCEDEGPFDDALSDALILHGQAVIDAAWNQIRKLK